MDETIEPSSGSERASAPLAEMRPGGGGHGRIVAAWDSERARAAVTRRWERYRRSAEAGMVAGIRALQPDATSREAAYAVIVAAQAELAASPDASGSPAAARFVRAAIGADVGVPERAAAAVAGGGGVEWPREVTVLVQAIRERMASDTEFAARCDELLRRADAASGG